METDIRTLIKRFMDGQTSIEEEDRLAEYFSTHEVDEDLQPYKQKKNPNLLFVECHIAQ